MHTYNLKSRIAGHILVRDRCISKYANTIFFNHPFFLIINFNQITFLALQSVQCVSCENRIESRIYFITRDKLCISSYYCPYSSFNLLNDNGEDWIFVRESL